MRNQFSVRNISAIMTILLQDLAELLEIPGLDTKKICRALCIVGKT